MRFLAADIGGSRARLLLGEAEAGAWRVLRREIRNCAGFTGVQALLADFLLPGDAPRAACLALAGPVVPGSPVHMTNRPWCVDGVALAQTFQIETVRLINDFAAQGHGLAELGPAGLLTLQGGAPQAGAPRLLIGPGTGLGMALVVGAPEAAEVLPSEGGHMDFAPGDDEGVALLAALRRQSGRVSLETVLSGAGLERIYAFVAGEGPPLRAEEISAAGLAGEPRADRALELFARELLSAAGNLALATLPQGGLFLAGGIAPRLVEILRRPEVLEAFGNKPPMRETLAGFPLHVVLDDLLGLWGAARIATRMTDGLA
ncbi:MAG: glucokinase [Zoogloeaceae bacterium]|nr:glucokinase [Zoogloeaceae bacterium]